MKAFLIIFLLCLSQLCAAQCNSILIEHKTGGGGGGHMNFWVVDNESPDTTLYDKFVAKHNDGRVYGCTFFSMSQPKSFSKVDKLLSRLNSKGDYANTLQWGCLEITKYDSNDKIIYRHYLCCGEETLKRIKKLAEKRNAKKYIEIKDLFDMMLFSLNATSPKN